MEMDTTAQAKDNGAQRPPEPSRKQMLNAREAAAYLGVSKNTLYRMEKDGYLIPFRTPGGHRRYKVEMLEDYLENSKKKSG